MKARWVHYLAEGGYVETVLADDSLGMALSNFRLKVSRSVGTRKPVLAAQTPRPGVHQIASLTFSVTRTGTEPEWSVSPGDVLYFEDRPSFTRDLVYLIFDFIRFTNRRVRRVAGDVWQIDYTFAAVEPSVGYGYDRGPSVYVGAATQLTNGRGELLYIE